MKGPVKVQILLILLGLMAMQHEVIPVVLSFLDKSWAEKKKKVRGKGIPINITNCWDHCQVTNNSFGLL